MSFSYSTSLTADLDKIRLLIADTDSTSVIFQNEEITGLLTMEPNVYMAAALAIRSRMAAFVTKAIAYRVGAAGGNAALEIDRTSMIKNFNLLADKYVMLAVTSVDEAFDRFAFDIDVFGQDRSEYQGYVYADG